MVVKEIPVPVVMGLDGVYFPAFPYPKDGIILPLDENNKVIFEDREDVQVTNVVMPYWYWKLIIKYVKDTETAVTALEAANQVDPLPP